MTKEGYIKHKAVIELWAAGADIEGKVELFRGHFWAHLSNPTWCVYATYRAKPQALVRYANLYSDGFVSYHDTQKAAETLGESNAEGYGTFVRTAKLVEVE